MVCMGQGRRASTDYSCCEAVTTQCRRECDAEKHPITLQYIVISVTYWRRTHDHRSGEVYVTYKKHAVKSYKVGKMHSILSEYVPKTVCLPTGHISLLCISVPSY